MNRSSRLSKLRTIALFAAALLFTKVLVAILLEYRWYFPADFDASAFLSGRRNTFVGVYRAAFYVHIISGPLAILFGVFLMLSGGRARFRHIHRPVGRSQMLLVLAVVAPSGLVMAQQAYAGPVAAYGFASLSIATAASASVALYAVRARNFPSHRTWATRCFLLLASPLLLRLIAGVLIVTEFESEWTYRLNAWISWLVPLAAYELWRRRTSGDSNSTLQYEASRLEREPIR